MQASRTTKDTHMRWSGVTNECAGAWMMSIERGTVSHCHVVFSLRWSILMSCQQSIVIVIRLGTSPYHLSTYCSSCTTISRIGPAVGSPASTLDETRSPCLSAPRTWTRTCKSLANCIMSATAIPFNLHYSPAGLLHNFRPVIPADLAKVLIAIHDGEVHYLSVGQQKRTVRCTRWGRIRKNAIKSTCRATTVMDVL